jgi:hypothetical protein
MPAGEGTADMCLLSMQGLFLEYIGNMWYMPDARVQRAGTHKSLQLRRG